LCQDRFYLEEDELARQLVEIGCRKGEASQLSSAFLRFAKKLFLTEIGPLTGADTRGFRS
jgi:hypothetical protein